MQFLPFDATRQQLDGTTKVIRFARIGLYVTGSNYGTLAAGVINAATGAAENPIDADYNGQARIGADGTFDVRITDPDGGDPIDYPDITWVDVKQQRDETVSARNEALPAAASAASDANRAELAKAQTQALVDAAALLAGIFTSDSLGLLNSVNGQQYLLRTADPQTYDKRTNNAGVAVADGQVSLVGASRVAPIEAWRAALSKLSMAGVYEHLSDKVTLTVDQAGRSRVRLRSSPTTDLKVYGQTAVDTATVLGLSSVANLALESYPTLVRLVKDASGRNRVRSFADPTRKGPYSFGGESTGTNVEYVQQLAPIALPFDYTPIRKAINAFVGYGQSLIVGAQGQPASSLTQPFFNITFLAGPKATKAGSIGENPGTSGFKALVEDNLSGDGNTERGETHCSALANGLVERAAIENGINPADFVVFASTAGHGGYNVSQLAWSASWSQVLRDHMTEAKVQADLLGKSIALHGIPVHQGEADSSTSYIAYQAGWRSIQSNASDFAQATFGQTHKVPLFWYQTPRSEQIQRAQIDLCLYEAGHFFVSGIFFMPPANDDTHLNSVGYRWIGAYHARSTKQYLIDQREPDFLKPLSATRRGRVIRWRWRVPRLPLTLRVDSSHFHATQDMGFCVVDSSGAVAISSIAIDGNDVVITLAADPVGTVKTRVGLDHHAVTSPWDTETTHNLTDSTTDTCVIGGVTYPMYHVAPAVEMTVITLP